ncbi:MAG: DMT family transporter [Thermoplasmatales archaeon]|nr:DMT family transporter [Thermoplasmatales archaeon]
MGKWKALTMILGAVLMWSASYPLIKIALLDVPPVLLGSLRHLIFIPMFIMIFINQGKNAFVHSRKNWLVFTGIGVFAIALPNIFQNIGMKYTTASLSSIIQSSGPVFTIALAVIFLGESLNIRKVSGAFIALTGTIMLVGGGSFCFAGSTFYGNILLLLSAISYSISGIITKKGLEKNSPFTLLGFGIMIGFVILSVFSMFTENTGVVTTFPPLIWIIILLLALFPSFIASWLWYKVLINTELSKLAVFVYLMPVFAVLFSYIMIQEVVDVYTLFFAALIIGGVVIAQKSGPAEI